MEKNCCFTRKGCESIKTASQILCSNVSTSPGQRVYKTCRRDFSRQKEILRYENASTRVFEEKTFSLRSKTNFFLFKDHCLFCSQPVKIDGFKRGLDCFPVRTATKLLGLKSPL